MKRLITIMIILLSGVNIFADSIVLDTLKAFPTAVGAGRFTTGGRGGRVLWVTNKNFTGKGSLLEALAVKGKATILFKNGGSYYMNAGGSGYAGNKTIAGQSANKFGGVYYDITDGANQKFMVIGGGNNIVRYIGTRGLRKLDGYDGDPLMWVEGNNVIMDHITDFGGAQGNSPFMGTSTTVQYSLYTEANHDHNVGIHNYVERGNEGYADIFYNAFILKSHRVPDISGTKILKSRVINNYAYGWGTRAGEVATHAKADFINNLYQEDLHWQSWHHKKHETFAVDATGLNSKLADPLPSIYLKDNFFTKKNNKLLFSSDNSSAMLHDPSQLISDMSKLLRTSPLDAPDIIPFTKKEKIKHYVLDNAGASVRYSANGSKTVHEFEKRYKDFALNRNEDKTPIKQRVAYTTIKRSNRILSGFQRSHGFPKKWAKRHGLDIKNSNIHNKIKKDWRIQGYSIKNNAGYTNLEMYLAELAGDFHMLAKY